MKHFFSTRVRVVLIAALLLAVVLSVVSSLVGISIPDLLVKGVLSPIQTGASGLLDHAENLYSYVFKYEALAAENEALKQQLSQMQDDARKAASLERENKWLRDALELKTAHESFELVDGYIISRSSTEWTSTITINQGSNVGLTEGMCAITANGEVVGLISEVGPNYAIVKTVLDSSLEVSATIAASGYNGTVQGGYSTGLAGLLRMDYLPTSSVIRNNDQVVTAGSVIYPRNLILGYVVDAGFDDTGVAKYAILKPAVDIGALEQVLIVTEYDPG